MTVHSASSAMRTVTAQEQLTGFCTERLRQALSPHLVNFETFIVHKPKKCSASQEPLGFNLVVHCSWPPKKFDQACNPKVGPQTQKSTGLQIGPLKTSELKHDNFVLCLSSVVVF